jgi:hypothetical protein
VKVKDKFIERGLDWMIILKLILKKYGVWEWTGFKWFRIGFSGGFILNAEILVP